MIRDIEGLAKLHSKIQIKLAYLFIDIIETISCIIFIIMFLIRLHPHAVGRQPAGHNGACTASDNALCEGSSHVRLNPLFNTVCRRPVPVKLA